MRSKYFILLLVVLSALLVGTAVSAQEATPAMTMLSEETHQMDWFIGEWDVISRLKLSEDEWLEEPVSSTVSSILGGFALMETYTGTFNGSPIEALSIRTYNPTLGRWQQRWLDTTSTSGFSHWTGDFADGEFIGYSDTSYKAADDGGFGEDVAYREIFTNIEENSFNWRYEYTADGGETWEVQWTLDYTRAM